MNKYFTLKEIYQQEELWLETITNISNIQNIIKQYLYNIEPLSTKIIFTGAGTSEFVGNILKETLGNNFDTIPTTDIISSPETYFHKNIKTVLVSFARSGNSPESLASIKLADELIENIYHIIITCNKNGKIALYKKNSNNALIIFMPEQSNDKGFAMTSSFTCMTLAGMSIFNLSKLQEIKIKLSLCINSIKNHKKNLIDLIKILNFIDVERIIYLGSSALKYLSEEASLKYLELTSGKISTFYNSPLGFRHGPKSIVNDKTMIIIFLSNNNHTRKYEIDLIKEIYSDRVAKSIVVLDMKLENNLQKISDYYFSFNLENDNLENIFNVFPYTYFAQLLAVYKSINLGINPDNPCPTGEVNRVVKGVIIHEYK